MWRQILCFVCLFVLGFMIAAISLKMILPERKAHLPVADDKLVFLETREPKPDILFIGSSRTYRLIDIPVINETLGKSGCALTAFNLGYPNMALEELFYFQKRLQQMNLSPRLVVLEEPLGGFRFWSQIPTERIGQFSDFESTTHRLQNIWSFQDSNLKKLYRTGIALTSFGYHMIDPGGLARLLTDNKDSKQDADQIMLQNGGYLSLELRDGDNIYENAAYKRLQAGKDRFVKKLENAKKITLPENTPPSATARAKVMMDLFDLFETETALYVPPQPERIWPNALLTNAIEERGGRLILDYNDPSALPDLWVFENWFDAYHLNAKGASILSKDIGQRLAEHLCSEEKR